MEGLEAFIVRAKAACYIGSGAVADASRPLSHDLTFAEGAWSYRDSYFGGTDFIGQEVVWHAGAPVWAMNYYGRIFRDDLMDAADGGRVIKAALAAMYREGRFLGGFQFALDRFSYEDASAGDYRSFTGVETISASGVPAYRLDYHGGMVRD